jgi:tRNA pseudouridine55 synthase
MHELKDNSINLIHKPKGITSFDVIRIIKNNTTIKKIGHAGTLDPNAEGLMILGTGTGTKDLTELVGLDKTYIAEIKLGIKTDSGDIDGKIIETLEIPSLGESEIKKTILSLIGVQRLPVSLFSAIKKNGKPLYKYARAGKDIAEPLRDMTINDAKFISFNQPVITAEFNVSSGTYIRSIAEEVARKLETIGTLMNLRRTVVGTYKLDDAVTIPKNIVDDFIEKKKERLANKKTA